MSRLISKGGYSNRRAANSRLERNPSAWCGVFLHEAATEEYISPVPGLCLNSWQTDGCEWIVGYLWRSSNWFERLDSVALGLMLAYTVFVCSRFSFRYYIARHQSRTLVPDSTRAFQRSQKRLISELNRGVGTLKAIASTAPFLGLAGTCNGILGGFRGVGMQKDAALAMMFADISGALIATAAGLFVAIPAAVSYNILRMRIDG
jgi:hypothetical protein